MKTRKLLAFMAMGLIALAQVGCGENGSDEVKPTPTGIVLDQTSMEIEVDSTVVLKATIQPEGAEGTVVWSSTDPAVAIVIGGEVKALKAGETVISAALGAFTATCNVKVTPKALEVGELLSGSDYHLIFLDETTYESVSSKVTVDARPNGESIFFDIWASGETFSDGTPVGTNFAGQTAGWMSLVVAAPAGWSGGGWAVRENTASFDFSDVTNNPDDYVLHIALKSSQESSSYLFLIGEGEHVARVCIGSTPFTDNGVTYQPYGDDITRDGEWNSVVIPVSDLVDLGCSFANPITSGNIVAVLGGATSGVTLDMDGVFFYKPAQE